MLSNPHHKTRALLLLLVVVVVVLVVRIIFNTLFHEKRPEPPISVGVAGVKMQDVPVYFPALGTVIADQTITIKTQINGILTHVYFKDGKMIQAGQVLAEIDPRTYQAQVTQYEGQVTRDSALLANAKIDLKRYIDLYCSHAVSQQTLRTQESLVKQYEGTLKIDEGQLGVAKTNLSYCTIVSPVTGRIGLTVTDKGNFVQTSDPNGIAVITTLSPIEVYFPLPQDDLPAVAERFNAGKKLIVEAYDRTQKKLLATGVLIAIDSQINTATGTIQLEAEFPNKNNELFPNQFVIIKLLVQTLHGVLVVPTAAVQQGATGAYVYRYNVNHTVTNVPVTTGVIDDQNTVITSGLAAHQIVVTDGTDKLYTGAKVKT